jgi:hypothetical protein
MHYRKKGIDMEKKRLEIIVDAVWMIATVLYCVFVIPMCEHSTLRTIAMFALLVYTFVRFLCFSESSSWKIVIVPLLSMFGTMFCSVTYKHNRLESGPTVITQFYITTQETYHISRGRDRIKVIGNYAFGNNKVEKSFIVDDALKCDWTYVWINIDCPKNIELYTEEPTGEQMLTIRDFAFVEDDTVFTYHDYTLKRPDVVHNTVGINLVYKAWRSQTNLSDSTVTVNFKDVAFRNTEFKVKLDDLAVIPDTFLISHNPMHPPRWRGINSVIVRSIPFTTGRKFPIMAISSTAGSIPSTK